MKFPSREEESLERHFKPRLQQLLRTLGVDVAYERGQGNHLYHRDDQGREIEVLDLVGGYGSLLLGHAHPALVAEAQRLLSTGRPIHAQGSRREYAARLACELSRRASGDYCVLFGNSGTEAVEAAMKHALLETGGRTFIALEGAFHGKTLGALQLTAHPDYRESFELPGPKVLRVAPDSIEQLEAAFARVTDPAGFVFEPILGEGGVRPLNAEFIQRAARLCASHRVPLIADECQSGLGRTGSFLACERMGVRPDYVVLSKSLGGGLAKISALLIRRERYVDTFDLRHTSTYAEDDYSCALALKTLELIDEPLIAACEDKGGRLMAGLRRLAARHPEVIAGVRGRGLMIGLEFRRLTSSPSFIIRFLTAQEDLVWVVMGYLLNVHRVRAAPTLSDRFTLRLEPSVLIGDREIQQTLDALEEVCARLGRGDAPGLTAFLPPSGSTRTSSGNRLARSDAKFVAHDEPCFQRRRVSSPSMSVAWLCHLVDSDDLASLEPGFVDQPADRREALMEHLAPRVAPVAMNPVDIRSITGASIRFQTILLPFTSHWVKQCIDARQTTLPRALVQRGADLARSLGCRLVSLGQYTSIVTFNGLRLDARGLGVTSGNSYSVALAVEAVEHAQRQTGSNPRESVLVVAGAAGNIGRACAELLAPHHRRTLLVGSTRPGSRLRLQELARRIPRARLATGLDAVAEGDVVVVALNAVDAPLVARHFKPGALVCDLSVPAALQAGVAMSRPDVRMVHGGIALLPGGEDLGLVGFPLPRGQVYGCMAEALLLAFDGARDIRFTGPVTMNHVSHLTAMAQRHGFSHLSAGRASAHIDSGRASPTVIAETPRFVPDIETREETHAIAF